MILKTRVDRIFVDALEVAIGFIFFIPGVFLQSSSILIVLGVGLLCVAVRDVFISLIPFLLQNINWIDTVLNIWLQLLSFTIDSIEIIVDAIVAAIDFILGKKPPNFSKLTELQVSTGDLQVFLQRVQRDCPPIDNAGKVIQSVSLASLNGYVCPAMRFAWAIEWLRPLLDLTIGWLSFPFNPTQLDPSKPGNCECDPQMAVCPARDTELCAILGLGYVIVEVILPLSIVAIGWTYFGKALLGAIWNSIMLLFDVVLWAIRRALFVLRFTERLSQWAGRKLEVKI